MAIIFNGTTLTDIKYNGITLNKVIYNGITVFSKSIQSGTREDSSYPNSYIETLDQEIVSIVWNGVYLGSGDRINWVSTSIGDGWTYYSTYYLALGKAPVYRIKN